MAETKLLSLTFCHEIWMDTGYITLKKVFNHLYYYSPSKPIYFCGEISLPIGGHEISYSLVKSDSPWDILEKGPAKEVNEVVEVSPSESRIYYFAGPINYRFEQEGGYTLKILIDETFIDKRQFFIGNIMHI